MKTESDFTRWFCDQLTKCNCKVSAMVASQMQQPGLPDRHIMHKSFPQGQVWLEFKKDGGKLREDQVSWLLKADEHEAHYAVLRWRPRQQDVLVEDVRGKRLGLIDLVTTHSGVELRKALVACLLKHDY